MTYQPLDALAEEAVLAGLFSSPEAYFDVSELLQVSDFGVPAFAEIYRAIGACDAAGKPFDHVTVVDELRRSKQLAKVGGPERVLALVEGALHVDNIRAHVDVVLEKSKVRRLLSLGRLITSEALDPESRSEQVRETAEKGLFALSARSRRSSLTSMAEAVPALLLELAEASTGGLLGVPTGLARLDAMTAGLQGGQLVLLAARPGVGKSALALQMARFIAETSGKMVLFNSFEMSNEELVFRLLSNALDYDGLRLQRGDIPDALQRDLSVAASKLGTVPLWVDDNPPSTITAMRSAMRRLATREPLGAIFIDYLQLMQGESRYRDGNRNLEVSDISRGLKLLATELNVPIIALSQLSRNLEQRADKRPVLSDLRDSGSLEQDANTVLFLYREHLYSPLASEETGELIVAKQRSGPCGTVHLKVSLASSRMRDVDAPLRGPGGGSGTRYERPF